VCVSDSACVLNVYRQTGEIFPGKGKYFPSGKKKEEEISAKKDIVFVLLFFSSSLPERGRPRPRPRPRARETPLGFLMYTPVDQLAARSLNSLF